MQLRLLATSTVAYPKADGQNAYMGSVVPAQNQLLASEMFGGDRRPYVANRQRVAFCKTAFSSRPKATPRIGLIRLVADLRTAAPDRRNARGCRISPPKSGRTRRAAYIVGSSLGDSYRPTRATGPAPASQPTRPIYTAPDTRASLNAVHDDGTPFAVGVRLFIDFRQPLSGVWRNARSSLRA